METYLGLENLNGVLISSDNDKNRLDWTKDFKFN